MVASTPDTVQVMVDVDVTSSGVYKVAGDDGFLDPGIWLASSCISSHHRPYSTSTRYESQTDVLYDVRCRYVWAVLAKIDAFVVLTEVHCLVLLLAEQSWQHRMVVPSVYLHISKLGCPTVLACLSMLRLQTIVYQCRALVSNLMYRQMAFHLLSC